MLPQSIEPSYMEYFKQKELQQQHMLEELSDLSLKQVIKSLREVSFLYPEERQILIFKERDAKKNPDLQVFLSPTPTPFLLLFTVMTLYS